MRARTLVPFGAAALLTLTACGATSHKQATSLTGSATSGLNTAQPGYLAQTQNGVAFVQFLQVEGAVDGTFSEDYYDPNDPTQLKKQQATFSGTISGSAITLMLDSGSIWSGTVTKSRLVLTSLEMGSRSKIIFRAANAAAYKNALAALTPP